MTRVKLFFEEGCESLDDFVQDIAHVCAVHIKSYRKVEEREAEVVIGDRFCFEVDAELQELDLHQFGIVSYEVEDEEQF